LKPATHTSIFARAAKSTPAWEAFPPIVAVTYLVAIYGRHQYALQVNMSSETFPSEVRFAVMSDLHCRLRTDLNESFFVVGDCRIPSGHHPVQALLELVKRDKLSAEVLLVPGDLANKARLEGLSQGWDSALEVARELGCSQTLPVLGNHDIESRRPPGGASHDANFNPRNLRPGFPFSESVLNDQFFSQGFCIVEPKPGIRIILLNSVVDHVDEQSATHGSFGHDRIEKLKSVLSQKQRVPICLAMLHHHPVLHSGFYFSNEDVIPTGDSLLSALREFGCEFVIHGHKHMARLTSHLGAFVFAAGSFSALLNAQGTSMGNMFHMVDLKATNAAGMRGCIKTWTFQYGTGWIPSNLKHRGFPHITGFGRQQPIPDLVNALVNLSSSHENQKLFLDSEVIAAAPDLEYSTPDDYASINMALGQYKLKLIDYDESRFGLGKIG
jgi:3',5'-cyclic AMP phosphodiesterase CpdA